MRCSLSSIRFAVAVLAMAAGPGISLFAQSCDFLSDPAAGISMTDRQQWGVLGRDTAAHLATIAGTPLRIGEQVYDKGIGHHAGGELVVDLRGRYSAFQATLGVQWQGGDKGSVTFRIVVDGQTVFNTGPMSDSDPAKEVNIPLNGATELRLVASDSGDGIGCDMANWANARLVRDPNMPFFETVRVTLNEAPAPLPSASTTGLAIIAGPTGPQVVVKESLKEFTACIHDDEEVCFSLPVRNLITPMRIAADVTVVDGEQAEVELSFGEQRVVRSISDNDVLELAIEPIDGSSSAEISLAARSTKGPAAIRWRRLRYTMNGQPFNIPLVFAQAEEQFPPPVLPSPRPFVEQEIVEWDWRMQDGIGTLQQSRTWAEAITGVFEAGDALLGDLAASGVTLEDEADQWEQLRAQWESLSVSEDDVESQWEKLWREVHALRRRIAFQNPLAQTGPLLFVKRVPSSFSHQLTQYYGRTARPGGGVFVLDAPGQSMQCRPLVSLPVGSCEHLDVSWDGRRVLFAFCETDRAPKDWHSDRMQYYHLYEAATDGSYCRQVTDGPYDDFSPRYLPDGKILFLSTRRGGFHRCGRGPCPVYTMAVANADGSDPRVISYHETHEWDPAILNDGRIIYTRWDYVDRHAVHYQQLWAARPDGSCVTAFYGNNTLNPVGVWEARPVPDSNLVMATAGAHHAMTAGSIILLDVTQGIDGLEPITRLTPDALFPESEFRVERWHATAGVPTPPTVPEAELRWPGHCYRTPYPLSKDYFLAAYSFDPLIGEPFANQANMFGIYLVDSFGNKELIYRDANIGSLWPSPMGGRHRPPALPSALEETNPGEGTFFVQNVYDSWPKLPSEATDTITKLRILQVLPKTTPHSNTPRVGLANASPGKQVLGTVPVEEDGSAYFRAPAEIPLSFQALDQRGMAVQTMRSLTYLQPGEHTACVGCHEHRSSVPDVTVSAMAKRRPPSVIAAGPDGSKPLSYPLLVQPVLDKHCISCHAGAEAEGGVVLTGSPAGNFSASYNALAPLVSYSEWKSTPQANAEPMSLPDHFGARASELMKFIDGSHEGITLSADEMERLVTWMDANALFYGTFEPSDQARQLRGERIAGPALE